MRVIDAIWEKENIGVDTTEVVCDGKETRDELIGVLEKVATPYSVLKMPVGNYNLLLVGQDCGYRVIELAIRLTANVNRVYIPEIYRRFLPNLQVRVADKGMEEKVFDDILSGKIFSTDRIALDPHFSKELAGRRYYNWCKKMVENGANLAIAFYKDDPVAFNISSKPNEKKACNGLLGGVFPEALDRGLGFLVPFTQLESCKMMGGITAISSVSSNNPPILKIHNQYGYEIREMNYVLIKHQ